MAVDVAGSVAGIVDETVAPAGGAGSELWRRPPPNHYDYDWGNYEQNAPPLCKTDISHAMGTRAKRDPPHKYRIQPAVLGTKLWLTSRQHKHA